MAAITPIMAAHPLILSAFSFIGFLLFESFVFVYDLYMREELSLLKPKSLDFHVITKYMSRTRLGMDLVGVTIVWKIRGSLKSFR
jgi:hypothetical protein